ncbi:hypothetical protein QOT17_019812 [Balamuthia mandrillaris]
MPAGVHTFKPFLIACPPQCTKRQLPKKKKKKKTHHTNQPRYFSRLRPFHVEHATHFGRSAISFFKRRDNDAFKEERFISELAWIQRPEEEESLFIPASLPVSA